MNRRSTLLSPSLAVVTLVLSAGALVAAQTTITPPSNSYSPAQDVELGQKAAQEMRAQLPLLPDEEVRSYIEGVGKRLVGAIPTSFRHPEFRYTFEVVNVREINASALPGGPMFVNRGMIEAAKTEGEIAGVMAHEISHVVLRHGTAQASKAAPYEIGSVLGQIAGAVIGGGWGQVVSGVSQFGFGTAFLRFSREFEKQADIEGTHIMAAAGYDPRDMANVFRAIEQESGPGGPQWLSDHPNPGNRVEYITQEAKELRVERPVTDTRAFQQVQASLKRLPRAPTTEEAVKNSPRTAGGNSSGTRSRPTGNVESPSTRFKSYSEGNLFEVSVPSNWREWSSSNTVTFAPENAYGEGVFTHGIELGLARNESHDLQAATDELVQSLARQNPNLGRPAGYERITIDGLRGLKTAMSNTSDGHRERIAVYSMLLRNGNLFYAVAVAPEDQYDAYRGVFDRVVASLRLNE